MIFMDGPMKQKPLILVPIFLALILSACGGQPEPASEPAGQPAPAVEQPTFAAPASTPTNASTPDPCAPENIRTEIESVHKLMREFDDASLLASNTPLDQLNPTIADLQRIRRDAEDQDAPACLMNLIQFQLAHMNTVINTLLGFLSGADQEALNQGIALARQQHDQYTLELATLLGLTVVAPPAPVVTDGTPVVVATPTFDGLYVTNPGPTTVNIRALPDLNSNTLGLLDVGASVSVLGRTADALWYQIEFPGQPGQTAWVYVSLVQISDPNITLPVATPAP